ncbi:MAG TPA: porin [Rhizomicrobium sp.]|jgi:phosphate-selective porin OprO/OprP|nr:porin [Rhizomicrobium sp.]
MARLSRYKVTLMAGVMALAVAGPADAETGSDAAIQSLQQQINDLNAQLQALKQKEQQQEQQPAVQPANPVTPPPASSVSTGTGAIAISTPTTSVPRPLGASIANGIVNGKPVFNSSDGQFTAAIRLLGQFDTAYYMQGNPARSLPSSYGPELSSGENFRRAWFGIYGKAFGDWSYVANFDFGGSSGTENPGHIQSLFMEYDGLKPFAFRVGAYPPPAGLEDGTPSSDLMFLERTSPTNMARNMAGGDGRDAASLLYIGDRIFGAFSVTGGKVGDSPVYQEQDSLLGRIAGLVYSTSDTNIVLGATGTDIVKLPDATVGPDPLTGISLGDTPELTVDSNGTKLVSSGTLSAKSAQNWGVEGAAQWRNFYGQAGYFGYDINREHYGYPDDSFDGWYAQASWVITGEHKNYKPSLGAFVEPDASDPFSFSHGIGAWELVGRYSDLDLNQGVGLAGTSTPYGGVRGGDQKIWTVGLNWYPNSLFRFMFDYQNIGISRLSSSGDDVGQTVQALAMRAEISY